MKIATKYISALLAVIMIFALGTAAFADNETGEESVQTEAAENTEEISAVNTSDSWDDIVENLLRAYDTDLTHVTLGYLNLVTGEEHYLNGDEYFVAAGMYRLPLAMYVTRLYNSGKLEWDESRYGVDFKYARDGLLGSSGNEWSDIFFTYIGGYDAFRRVTTDYVAEKADQNLSQQYIENKYTARGFINCLNLLYSSQEEFSGIIETLKTNEPERFFKLKGLGCEAAQKYGYVTDEYGSSFMNNCGIVFASQPVALVIHTKSVMMNEELIADYAKKMCEYTESAASSYVPATPEPTPAEPVSTPKPAPTTPEEAAAAALSAEVPITKTLIAALILIFVFAVLADVKIIVYKTRYGAKVFWILISAIFSICAMLTAVVGPSLGTVYASTKGDPSATTAEFFNAIMEKDYSEAYKKLRDYTDLGMEIVPASEPAMLVNTALRDSYSYELTGGARIDKLSAVQPVRLQYMDINLAQEDIHSAVNMHIEKIVDERDVSEIYDSNRNYLPEVTHEVYTMAVRTVMEHPEKYYTTVDINLPLEYVNNQWLIVADSALLKALNGNAGY